MQQPMHRALAMLLTSILVVVSAAASAFAQAPFGVAEPPVMLPLPQVGGSVQPGSMSNSAMQVTKNQMLWQQYQALNMPASGGDQSCATCGGRPYNRCGCEKEVFPWINGPGSNDQWCVGPRWESEVSGLMLFRENADWASVIGNVGVAPTLINQFDHGPGGRIFLTGYNQSGFGVQVGYEGVNDWDARAEFPLAGAVRTFDYESTLNSVELNFLPEVDARWKFFGGVRYVEIAERLGDFTVADKPVPAPADPPAAPVAVIDAGTNFQMKNRMIGFQLGGRRDTWHLGKWISIESFFNGGVYCNKFKRRDIARTLTTTISGDDLATPDVDEFSQNVSEVSTVTRRDDTEIAFLGEAGITGIARLNQSIALRGGYQVMVVDGVGEGLDGIFTTSLQRRTLLYHGLQFGLEYRR